MRIDVITLFPSMFDGLRENGISRIALERGAAELACYNPRDFTDDAYHTVDGRPYGGGPGMVMLPGPLDRSIGAVREYNTGPLIYLSPQGEVLTQDLVRELSDLPAMALLCGRYEGVDERILSSRVDREISIGDYVLAGGELAAMVLIESVLRLLPGVLGNAASVTQDSFSDGLLDHPHYTRPEVYRGMAVPPVLLGGNHADIARWRLMQSLARTRRRRPDLFGRRSLDEHEQAVIEAFDLEQNDE
jgi:tRNA (guanine37-N1)-methyltransferase